MSEMKINPVVKDKVIKEYEFVFDSGFAIPVTIDEEAGDWYDDQSAPDRIYITIAGKPTMSNPDALTSPERITIYLKHIAAIQCRERRSVELSPDERFDLASFVNSKVSNRLQ